MPRREYVFLRIIESYFYNTRSIPETVHFPFPPSAQFFHELGGGDDEQMVACCFIQFVDTCLPGGALAVGSQLGLEGKIEEESWGIFGRRPVESRQTSLSDLTCIRCYANKNVQSVTSSLRSTHRLSVTSSLRSTHRLWSLPFPNTPTQITWRPPRRPQ